MAGYRENKNMRVERFMVRFGILAVLLLGTAACDTVPRESVELSNTVGRDLEEVHRAHRALAQLHFGKIEDDINRFIDDTYRPAFIARFAGEFRLNDQIERILRDDPAKLLPVLTRFVTVAVERIEKKRTELLAPLREQKNSVIEEIDSAHRQIQAAQAVVTGHLASVMKVREVQNEFLAKAGLGGVREKIAKTTATISDKVDGFVRTGEKIRAEADSIESSVRDAAARVKAIADKVSKIDEAMDKLKTEIRNAGN